MGGISYVHLDGCELLIYANDLAELAQLTNVDVELVEPERIRWAATFFTLDSVEALFQKNAITGECARGTYLWAADMILVRTLSLDTIQTTIVDLRENGEFDGAFSRLDDL